MKPMFTFSKKSQNVRTGWIRWQSVVVHDLNNNNSNLQLQAHANNAHPTTTTGLLQTRTSEPESWQWKLINTGQECSTGLARRSSANKTKIVFLGLQWISSCRVYRLLLSTRIVQTSPRWNNTGAPCSNPWWMYVLPCLFVLVCVCVCAWVRVCVCEWDGGTSWLLIITAWMNVIAGYWEDLRINEINTGHVEAILGHVVEEWAMSGYWK